MRKTKSCIFKGLPQHFIHWLSFSHRCFVYVYAGEQNRLGLTCAWLNCHSSLIHTSTTLFGRNTRDTVSSHKKKLFSSLLGTTWGSISYHEPKLSGIILMVSHYVPNYMPWTLSLLVWLLWSRMKMQDILILRGRNYPTRKKSCLLFSPQPGKFTPLESEAGGGKGSQPFTFT